MALLQVSFEKAIKNVIWVLNVSQLCVWNRRRLASQRAGRRPQKRELPTRITVRGSCAGILNTGILEVECVGHVRGSRARVTCAGHVRGSRARVTWGRVGHAGHVRGSRAAHQARPRAPRKHREVRVVLEARRQTAAAQHALVQEAARQQQRLAAGWRGRRVEHLQAVGVGAGARGELVRSWCSPRGSARAQPTFPAGAEGGNSVTCFIE